MSDPDSIPKSVASRGVKSVSDNAQGKAVQMSSLHCHLFVAAFGDEIFKRMKQKKAAQHG